MIISEEEKKHIKKLYSLNEETKKLQISGESVRKNEWLEFASIVMSKYDDYKTYVTEFPFPFPAVNIKNHYLANNFVRDADLGICFEGYNPSCYDKIIIYDDSDPKNPEFKLAELMWNSDYHFYAFYSVMKLLPEVEVKPTQTQILNRGVKLIASALKKKKVTDPRIVATIIGICSKESNFTPAVESTHLADTYWQKTHFEALANVPMEEIEKLKKDPVKFYNFVYGPKTKTGKYLKNTKEGDGYRYRGRGFNQLTGRGAYASAGYENNPEELEKLSGAIDVVVKTFVDITGFALKKYPETTSLMTIAKDTLVINSGTDKMTSFFVHNLNLVYNFIINNLLDKNGDLVVPGYKPMKIVK